MTAPAAFYERAVLARVCLCCAKPGGGHETQELCTTCWVQLTATTRARLRQRDHDGYLRTLELLTAIHHGTPLASIEVTA